MNTSIQPRLQQVKFSSVYATHDVNKKKFTLKITPDRESDLYISHSHFRFPEGEPGHIVLQRGAGELTRKVDTLFRCVPSLHDLRRGNGQTWIERITEDKDAIRDIVDMVGFCTKDGTYTDPYSHNSRDFDDTPAPSGWYRALAHLFGIRLYYDDLEEWRENLSDRLVHIEPQVEITPSKWKYDAPASMTLTYRYA